MSPSVNVEGVYTAHGILASLAWAVLPPIAGILLRFVPSRKAWIIHGGIMTFAMLMFTISFVLGLNRVQANGEKITSDPHYIIGTIVFALGWLLPILGLAHHYMFVATGRRFFVSTFHVFFGRLLMMVGMINGGIGIWRSGPHVTHAEAVAYAVCVSLIWLAYIVVSLYHEAEREAVIRLGSTSTSSASSQVNVPKEYVTDLKV